MSIKYFAFSIALLILVSCAHVDESGIEVLVGYSSGDVLKVIEDIPGVDVEDHVDGIDVALLSLKDISLVERIREIEGVEYVEFPKKFSIPSFKREGRSDRVSDQWGLLKIFDIDGDGTPNFEIWNLTDGSPVHVAIFDTPVDGTHPDLKGKIGIGYDPERDYEIPPGSDYQNPDISYDDHGTHVSGIISALDDGEGITGVAPGVVINPVVIFNPFFTGELNYAKGVRWAVERGVKVFSNSWGGGGYSYTIKKAIDYALESGVVVVFSAGNSYSDLFRYPAGYPGVIAVGASNVRDEKADFSSFGPNLSVLAPGEYILSTVPGGRYEFWSGTSMSAPHVSAISAMILSIHRNLRPSQVRKMIEKGAIDLYDEGFDEMSGYGRVSVGAVSLEVPEPGVSLRVEVVDSSGNPVPAVYLNLVSKVGRSYYVKTDLEGVGKFLEIDEGDYSLVVGGPDWLDPISDVKRPQEAVKFSTDVSLSCDSTLTIQLETELEIRTDPRSTILVFKDGELVDESFGYYELPEDHAPGVYEFKVSTITDATMVLNGDTIDLDLKDLKLCDSFGCSWRIF